VEEEGGASVGDGGATGVEDVRSDDAVDGIGAVLGEPGVDGSDPWDSARAVT
jgi:hypothetical protein